MSFDLVATEGEARAGVLHTAHGDVPTPAFMPVGTKGTVKGLDPERLRELGTTILLGNTYHLHFRPGEELVEAMGGLHRFMAWDGPILTDSGGFQVFSLRDTITAVDEEGVTFRSVYDGREARFTPELAADIQRRLGSDIAMCLDVCPPPDVPREELEAATALTTRWATRQLSGAESARTARLRNQPGRHRSRASSPLHGGDRRPRLRRPRSRRASVGETGTSMLETVGWAAPLLPAERPRYFMGIGDPAGILEVVERGIDMFDCVLPTRLGRTGSAITWEGRLNLKNARFARDERPLDESCSCSACRRFTRAYLRHLINQQELLGLILLSEHNVRFLLDLTAEARASIERGEFGSYKAATLERLDSAAFAPGEEVSR